jgi:hypothetical protein
MNWLLYDDTAWYVIQISLRCIGRVPPSSRGPSLRALRHTEDVSGPCETVKIFCFDGNPE